jgi:hypothetical protein
MHHLKLIFVGERIPWDLRTIEERPQRHTRQAALLFQVHPFCVIGIRNAPWKPMGVIRDKNHRLVEISPALCVSRAMVHHAPQIISYMHWLTNCQACRVYGDRVVTVPERGQ